jgi:hypothetical protein
MMSIRKSISIFAIQAGTVALLLGMASTFAATDIYVETVVDPSGQLRISTKHHREIVPKKERDQSAFADAQVSPDGRAVGWLALFPDPGGSEPLALKLMVMQEGEPQSFTGNGLPFSRWCFWAGGKQVAFEQQTVHGGLGVHYELRDLQTGDLADRYDPDANPDGVTKPPRWVVVLDSKG